MNTLRNQLLSTCLKRYCGHFANGEQANNKIHIECIADHPELRETVVNQLGNLAISYEPDFVAGVPSGGNWLAKDIAARFGIECISLKRGDNLQRSMDFDTELDREKCLQVNSGVLIEDLIRKFTNTRKVLAIPEIGERIVAEVAVFDRELDIGREDPGIPVRALVKEYIPPLLPDDSPLWEFTK